VLVLVGAPLVERGLSLIRHPNYLAVVGELVGAAMMLGTPGGTLASVLFNSLWKRIQIEEKAGGSKVTSQKTEVRSQNHAF
jgi:isoprenylcysteine carboxyl methyltransferase (ICMT) family protein YpbQ